MHPATSTRFEEADLLRALEGFDDAMLDEIEFGVIGFDADGIVRRYNATESRLAALPSQRVIGLALFTVVAPCMNNFMVAQRFADADTDGIALDVVLDYVLTLRMRPEKVKLRLLCAPGTALRYVVVVRRA